MNNIAYIELGGNQGDRLNLINQAKKLLQENGCQILLQSAIFETPPWGFEADKNFYNQVVKIKFNSSAKELLELLMRIEKDLGRSRGKERYTSRTIDLDILFFNDEIIENEDLQIPHSRLHLRNFVLEPLNEIAPDLIHPVFNKSITQLLQECTDESRCIKLNLG